MNLSGIGDCGLVMETASGILMIEEAGGVRLSVIDLERSNQESRIMLSLNKGLAPSRLRLRLRLISSFGLY